MRIIILGGHGFVGKNLTSKLEQTEHEIFPFSRADGLDLTNIDITKTYFKKIKPDVIVNAAAHVGSVHYVTTHAADVIYDNIQMILNIYHALRDIRPDAKVINPLSNCSYPASADIQRESEWWNGEVHESVFSYGNYKRMAYVISKCYNKQYNINSINFLFPNTFGVGDSADPNRTHALNGMIIRMIKAQKRGDSEFEIWGTGNPIREWCYIEDAVNILKGKLVFNTKYQDGDPIKILDDRNFKSIFPNYEFYDHKKGIEETVEYYKSIL